MPITDWPMNERPRERLLHQGVNALSDAELLAIFLRTGVKGKTAVDLARELIKQFGLRGLLQADLQTFCQQPGMGKAKYAQLQACLEMGRRHLFSQLQHSSVLNNPHDAAYFLLSQLSEKNREVFAVLFMDAQHQVLAYEELFFGGIQHVAVHPREIVKRVLHHNASAVLIAHNHPSGDIKPSQQDLQLTKSVQAALALVEVSLLDHMIIGHDQVFSFTQKGLLE